MTDISDEYKTMLRNLYVESHPQRQEGEFTIAEYAELNNITMQQAENDLDYKVRQGRLIKPEGKRYIDFKMRTVYKLP